MRFVVALLLTSLAWGQTITNWKVDGITHSTAWFAFDKSDPTTRVYGAISTGTIADPCVPSTGASGIRRVEQSFTHTAAAISMYVTALAPSTTFNFAVCNHDTNARLFSQTSAFTTLAEPAIHPVPPAPPLTTGHTAIPTGFSTRDETLDDCANWDSLIDDFANDASGANNLRIKVPSGFECTVNLTPGARSGGGTGWIVIESTATMLPPYGARVSKFDSNKQPILRGTITFPAATSKIWFRGINVVGPASGTSVDLINPTNCTDCVFEHNVIDRAGGSFSTRSAFGLVQNAVRVSVLDNYVEITRSNNSSCWYGDAGAANNNAILIQNNWLRCVGNTLYWEQGTQATAHGNVSIIRNTFDWDDKFRCGSPTSDGTCWGAWQSIEFKQMEKARIWGNWLRYLWQDQDEFAYNLSVFPRSSVSGQTVPIRAVHDVEFGFNFITGGSGVNLAGGVNDAGGGGGTASPFPANNFRIHNNLFARMRTALKPSPGATQSVNNRQQLYVTQGIEDAVFENNAFFDLDGGDTRQTSLRFDCGPIEGYVYRNNIIRHANANNAGGLAYAGSCPWPVGGSAPANTGPAKDLMDVYLYRLGSGASYSFTNNFIAPENPTTNGFTNATISAANWFPANQFFPGSEGSPASLAGFKGSDKTSEDLRDFCLASNSANIARGTDGRPLGPNCELLQEAVGGVQDVVVRGVTGTTADIAFRAPGGLTGPGTACAADVSTTSDFSEPTTSRVTATVNSAFPWNQSAQFTSLTVKTKYYFRTHCAGMPYTSGTFTTRPA